MLNWIFLVEMNVKGSGLNYLRPSVFYLCVRYILIVSYWCTSRTFILLWKNEHRWPFFQRCFRSMITVYFFISRIETWHNRRRICVSWHVSIIIPSCYYYNYYYYSLFSCMHRVHTINNIFSPVCMGFPVKVIGLLKS